MSREPTFTTRHLDTPRDKPGTERAEHANLERPGAQAHPVAGGWRQLRDCATGWRKL